MIRSFRHKNLRRLCEDRDKRGLPPEHVVKLTDILALLDAAQSPSDLDLPGMRLHQPKGDMKGFRAVTVRASWRVIFRFKGGDACDIDYLDDH